jgi:MYXO-CTERM domain-containing protein
LTRATWWPGVVLLAVVAAIRAPGPFLRRAATGGCVLVGLYAVGAPWLVRNVEVVGAPSWTTDAGRALWIGNNDHTFDAYPRRSIDESEIVAWTHLDAYTRFAIGRAAGDERRQDDLYFSEGLGWIRAHPGEFVARGFRKVGALFDPRLTPDPAPASPAKTWAHALSYGPALLLALIGLVVHRRRREFLPWLALVAGSIAVAFVFWGQTRLRVSLDPPMLLLSAVGLAALPGGRALVVRVSAWLSRTPPGAPAPSVPR